MNEVSIEKEERIEKFRSVLKENYQYSQQLDQIGTIFNHVNKFYARFNIQNFL